MHSKSNGYNAACNFSSLVGHCISDFIFIKPNLQLSTARQFLLKHTPPACVRDYSNALSGGMRSTLYLPSANVNSSGQ